MSDLPQADTPSSTEPGPIRIAARTALILLLFTLVFTGLMAGGYQLAAPRVAASALEQKLRLIGEVLPPHSYDNDLLRDSIELPPLPALAGETTTTLYRARRGDTPVALVFEAASNEGYSGRIDLILAVTADGSLLAMRVTRHKETPGLGDYIDPRKDRNKRRPWISQFNAIDFEHIAPEHWRVKKDGGRFDQMSGATISARAVTNASRRALIWANAHRERLFALPSGSLADAAELPGETP